MTKVWPTAKAAPPSEMTVSDTGTEEIATTPSTTSEKPPKASSRQRSLALYCSSTSASSQTATMPNAM
ncbi:hypothetical protein LUW77_07930 [Streptomyces radiopugnans]|nr:hypothetical protein LUW77_07930 [Streptomyces radiopugnans]